MKRDKTFKMALGGICLALTLIFMFAGSVAPGVELTLFAISSVFVAVMILETGTGGGILLYAAAVLLGFKELLLGSIHLPDYPVYLLIAAGILFLLLYDYIYTMIINLYIRRIKNRGGDKFKLS